jgi:predicted MFS family arabinose efflux permease
MHKPASPYIVAIAGLIGMAAAMGIGRFAYTPILPAMMEGLGQDAATAGLIASANYLGYLAGAILAAYGWAAGLERRMVLAGLAANAALLVAMALGDTAWLFALVRFLAGLASAFVMVFGAAIVLSHGAAAGNPRVQSIHFAGVGIGMTLSALMVGAIDAAGGDWRANWWAMAGLATLALLVVPAILPAGPASSAGAEPDMREPKLVWTRQLTAVMLAYGIFGFGYIITATFLVAIVRGEGGGAALEAAVWSVTGVAAAVSVAAGQPFVARFGLVAVFVGGCLLEAFGVAASVLLPSPAGPLVGGVLLGGTFVMITAYGLQLGRTLAPRSGRRVFAFMTAAFGIGQVAGPVAAGYLSDMTGSYTLASLCAAAALLAAAFAVWANSPVELRRQ